MYTMVYPPFPTTEEPKTFAGDTKTEKMFGWLSTLSILFLTISTYKGVNQNILVSLHTNFLRDWGDTGPTNRSECGGQIKKEY